MIGIYKITKKNNGKSYIGQSNDIQRRFKEHINRNYSAIEKAIQKYGKDAFDFEIIEECTLEELDAKEKYWINYYNTYNNGYNCNEGGGSFAGQYNGRTNLTDKDVEYIRDCYNNHKRRKEVYKNFEGKISFASFAEIWDGTTWKHIKPEVYTKENKEYYMYHTTDGANSEMAVLSSEDVIKCRKRYVNETAREIYSDYKDKISYQAFQQMLCGATYKNLPIYKKKQKRWINVEACNDYSE